MADSAQYKYDVFISYNHAADGAWVWDALLPRLKSAGLKVIVDLDFEFGVPKLVNIERAVQNSRYTIIVLTPAWLSSEWTEFESLLVGNMDAAGRKRRLLPLMLHPCQPPERIAMLHYADFTHPLGNENQFYRLLQHVQNGN
ncbi:toll/interleukin-1 receptor domain-containing protein [candidate division KSB1 bacterium]|nr:toll/interleukin-1 receptor domain-containing protein [candidate division KSB1 bacterium]